MKKYAVITIKNIHHEGDERSRTNPGHGYPAYTERVETFRTFGDEDDMMRHYEKWRKSDDVYIEYEELTFKTTHTVERKSV